ncbi:uncharacterized protein si:ch211-191i18.4 isoform X2 [Cololabis saira]|uniref:uncharacterized protein si:ch211-191i18.4 isoform X2 n=1 Tax=Cololabis saira TaxID=129043 RepID=UPI002AD3B4F0|nr:uncharacterized protein si:ch211-191i18.4 isoform X2 [Cololabis saira]
MKLNVCTVFLLLIFSWLTVDCSLPDFTPAAPRLQEKAPVDSVSIVRPLKKNSYTRLPGICRRLKRRRVTILCNLEKFCWGRKWWKSQKTSPGQVCRCPRGSRCSRFFLHSL